MVRTKRHKYVWSPTGKEALYDLEEDPDELVALSGAVALHGVRSEHLRIMLKELQRTEDPLARVLENVL